MSQLKNVLSPEEAKEVQKFIQNPLLKQAVKKILLFSVYYNGTLKPNKEADPEFNAALALAADPKWTDEELGRNLRAFSEGVRCVMTGFSDIEKFKVEEKKEKDTKNPAR